MPTITRFRSWWLVEWTRDNGLFQLLFRHYKRAYAYAYAITIKDEYAMRSLELQRFDAYF